MRGPPPPLLENLEQLPAAPQQPRSREKRRKLLEASRVLFAERGYEATSIEAITSRAGTSSGAFYTYFSSKRQILVALMAELLARLSGLDLHPGGGGDIRGGLRSFLSRVFRADLEYYGVVRAWHEASLNDADLGQMRNSIELWTEARILRLFQTLQRHPQARKHRNLRTFARMMDRHFWSLLARGGSMTARDLNREVKAADVNLLLYVPRLKFRSCSI